jgi:hypothetical protein
MNTTRTRKLFVTSPVGAVVASGAATALLFLGADSAQAIPGLSEHGAVAIIDHLSLPRSCGVWVGFNPQPEPPAFPDRRNDAGIGNPNDRPQITTPGNWVGLGGPDTPPPQHN